MISAGAMGYHEKWCAKNPVNFHKCTVSDCKHLIKEGGRGTIAFYCKAQNNLPMFTYKLKKSIAYKVGQRRDDYPRPLDGLTEMPKECNLYEVNGYEQYSETV